MSVYRIIGIEASPYSVKVRAVMRYMHIVFRWVGRMPQFFDETKQVKPLIMPVVQFPSGEYRTDSTPILLDIDRRHSKERTILPRRTSDAFLSLLIEDLADEWLTKCLFYFRFNTDTDARWGASWVIDDAHSNLTQAELNGLTDNFIERQTERMGLVGCSKSNGPILEKSYEEFLRIMEEFVARDKFFFGSRPSIGDFGVYGQLKTLGTDSTASKIMRTVAPRTESWVLRADDLSDTDGIWYPEDDQFSPVIIKILKYAATYYLPYLVANNEALEDGSGEFSITMQGSEYRQPCFSYHGKCLKFLVERFNSLEGEESSRVTKLLKETGCLDYFRRVSV